MAARCRPRNQGFRAQGLPSARPIQVATSPPTTNRTNAACRTRTRSAARFIAYGTMAPVTECHRNDPMSRFAPAVVLAAILAAAAPAFAQQKPSEIPVEAFFKRADVTTMALSPDGEKLAVLGNFKGRENLLVVDIAKRTKNVITSFEQYDVATFDWVNSKRLFLRVADARDVMNRARLIGTYAIDVDGENLRNLTDLVGGRAAAGSSLVANIEPLARTDDGTDDM